MRALEAAAFASGTSEADLQQRAGTAVAEEVYRIARHGRVVVLVGHGNNGRDGIVAALWLLQHGVGVDVVLAPRHAVTADELQSLRGLGATCIASEDLQTVRAALRAARI